jgi:hypothetical protein
MGGAPIPLEGVFLVGGIFVSLPLVVLLSGLAVLFHSPRFAGVAMLLAALPLLVLLPLVATYERSDHEYEVAAQRAGWLSLGLYAALTTAAGLSARRAATRSPTQESDGIPATASGLPSTSVRDVRNPVGTGITDDACGGIAEL